MDIQLINFKDTPYELQLETRNWRNSKDVTKFFKIEFITENMHKNWLTSLVQNNPTSIAFIIYADSTPIGVTYFHSINYINKYADWGIYIYDKKYRCKGIGHYVLDSSIKFAKNELQMEKLFLDVMSTNNIAISLYTSFGFKLKEQEKNNFLRYEKNLTSFKQE